MSAFFEAFWKGIEKYKIPIVLFAITLFLLIGCTIPKVFINDEWITLNQLSQLDQGHQVIINEGKYGMLENGTFYNYFQARGNYLGYTIFLPLISIPALECIVHVNESFMYILIVFWTLLLIGISLFIRNFFPNRSNYCGVDLTNLGIILAIFLFFLNLVFYQPFYFTGTNTYPEIAAIAFTNIILLSGLSVILFQIYLTLFKSKTISLSATVISICCSSFIFWTTSAKDHILVAVLLGILIYCGIKYIYTQDRWYIPALFIVIGLIAWARTEIAPPLFIVFSLIIVGKSILVYKNNHNVRSSVPLLLSPLFTIFGAIPFFINNYYVTGNFLVPPMTFYAQMNSNNISAGIVDYVSNTVSPVVSTLPVSQSSLSHLLTVLSTYYTIAPDVSLSALLRLFVLPANHSIGLFVVCPLLIIGLFCAFFSNVSWKNFLNPEKSTCFFLLLLIAIIFISYIPSWSGMNFSSGITPDVRYFSPMYLPLGILGLLLVQKSGILPNFSKNGIFVLLFTVCEITCILGIFQWLFTPSDKNFNGFMSIFTDTISCIVYALIILLIVSGFLIKNRETKIEYCTLIIHAIVVAPLIWQMTMIFSSAAGIGLEGYSYWIPIVSESMQKPLAFFLK
ncbi:MAG: hypothetical protein WCX22_02965 [Methanoregula sp.]